MPNWAIGPVDITGTRTAVLAFSDRFISDDEQRTVPGRRYFARSFLESPRELTRSDIMSVFEGSSETEERLFTLYISFAWSATSCMINGYPQQNQAECITLSEACIEDQVSVDIRTTEPGISFEEEIHCGKDGNCQDIEHELRVFKCPECGEPCSLASFEDPAEYLCCECGHEGMVPYETEEK